MLYDFLIKTPAERQKDGGPDNAPEAILAAEERYDVRFCRYRFKFQSNLV